MLDTKRLSVFIADELSSSVVATPLRITTHFQRDTLVVIEVVPIFEDITDTQFDCTAVLVPVDRVEVVPDEAVQVGAIITIPPIAGR